MFNFNVCFKWNSRKFDFLYDNISYSFSGKDISGSYYENKVLYERKLLLCVDFYAPEGTSGGILKLHRPSVRPSVTNRVSAISHKLLKQI